MFLRGFLWLCCHAQMLPCFDSKGRQLGLGFKGFDPEMAGLWLGQECRWCF